MEQDHFRRYSICLGAVEPQVDGAGMISRSGRVSAARAGTLAAVGVSLALHAGMAAFLVARLPRLPDAAPDFAVRVSLAAPGVVLGGASEAPLAAASPAIVAEAPASRPIEALAPTPAPAESVAAEPVVATLAPSADVGTPAAPEAAAVEPSASSSGPTPPATAHSTAGTETLQSAPALSAPATAALESPAAVSAGTAILPADVKPASPAAAETPVAAAAVPASGAQPVEALPARQVLAAPAEAVAPLAPVSHEAMSAAMPADAVAVDPPMTTVLPAGTPAPAPRVAAAEIQPTQGTVSATPPASVPIRPLSDAPPSLAPSAPQQAARPPDSTLTAHEESEAERARMIQSFIDRYDGGACFFAAPSETVSAALDVDSFAADKAKFRAFDEDFKTAMGRESHVQGQRIWTEQCPVVDLLQAGGYGARVPVVGIDRSDLRGGDILSGTIRTVGTEPIHLYLVSETGQVDDLTSSLRDRGDLRTFAVPINRNGVGGPFLQLLVAVSTDVPPFAAGTKADKIFAAIRAGAFKTRRSGFVGAKSFLLQP